MQHAKIGIAVCTLPFQYISIISCVISDPIFPTFLPPETKKTYKDSQIPEKESRSSPVLQLVRFLVVASKTEKMKKICVATPNHPVTISALAKPWDCSMRLLSAVFLPPRISLNKLRAASELWPKNQKSCKNLPCY